MKLYSCDFEGCMATTEKLREAEYWVTVEWMPRWAWLFLAVPLIGNVMSLSYFLAGREHTRYLCPEHAKRIKRLVRT